MTAVGVCGKTQRSEVEQGKDCGPSSYNVNVCIQIPHNRHHVCKYLADLKPLCNKLLPNFLPAITQQLAILVSSGEEPTLRISLNPSRRQSTSLRGAESMKRVKILFHSIIATYPSFKRSRKFSHCAVTIVVSLVKSRKNRDRRDYQYSRHEYIRLFSFFHLL